jgi:uncharacterized protein (TIGR03083 family)
MSKSDVMRDFRLAFDDLARLVEGLPEARVTEDAAAGWSVRDILGHFAGYHHDMATALENVGRGEKPPPPDGLSDDQRNAIYAGQARQRPVAHVAAEWRAEFERCHAAAQAFPARAFVAGRGPARWLAEETEHYREHTADIRGWLGRP